jgi:hypothetical protein
LEKDKFLKFKEMIKATGIRGIVLFTDSTGRIYGEFADLLKEEIHGGEYNNKDKTEMIYFWLKDLRNLKELAY